MAMLDGKWKLLVNADGSAAPALEVVAPGLFTTIQDTRGRSHLARFGVPTPAKNLYVTTADFCATSGTLF